MKKFIAVAIILFLGEAFAADVSWMYVQNRRYENGRNINRLAFGLIDEKGHNLTDGSSITDVKLYAPGGKQVKLKKYRFDSDEEIFGLYDAFKSQWFYKLKEAPWTLIMVAPGKQIFSTVIQFRLYYFITATAFIFGILLLIRLALSRTVFSIKALSDTANKVARGDFATLAPSKTKDEVGELIRNFNTMVLQLEERIRLKEDIDLAMEVQQNLLPQKPVQTENLDIAGQSIYCDETGGDYFDFFQFPELGPGKVGFAVGDVVGHGISAALLMTTVRAFIRSQMAQPGSLAQKVSAVNRLLCLDTFESCDFMTLFLVVVDSVKKELTWVRAGHDPAIIYDPSSGSIYELQGRGTVLGIDADYTFEEYKHSGWSEGQIVVVGTDGIWETENPHSENFGKFRLHQIIRQHSQFSSQEILKAITDALAAFRDTAPQNDDVTLVVAKARS